MTTAEPDTRPTRVSGAGYWLEPFGDTRWPVALQLLLREYPASTAAWWEAGAQRWRDVPGDGNRREIGVMMHGPRGLAGVVLMFGSLRPTGTPGERRVNPSSWAITEGARLRALWMAQQVLSEPSVTYTATTPIPAAARILESVGFVTLSDRRAIGLAARWALRRGPKARVLDTDRTLAALKGHALTDALADHRRLGCLVCGIESADGVSALVFRTSLRKRLAPKAELIYADSTAEVLTHAGPLSRFLLSRGMLLLELELAAGTLLDLPARLVPRRRLVRGDFDPSGIDHLYSELVYLRHP